MKKAPTLRGTTVVGVIHKGVVALGADGQATLGECIIKQNVQKIRVIDEGKVLVGFAGATADAFTLLERLEEKLSTYRSNLKRSAIALAKDWRTDKYLRRLEAMLIAADKGHLLIISGSGDVIEPADEVACIGSGGMYAQAAVLSLKKHAGKLSAEDLVREALCTAADICIYTNRNLTIETLS